MMNMVSESMIGKKVIVVLGSGLMQDIEMEGTLRGFDLTKKTIQLEKSNGRYEYTNIASIEVSPDPSNVMKLFSKTLIEEYVPTALMKEYMDKVQRENSDQGFETARNKLGSVIVKLGSMEVHYLPLENQVYEYIFENEENR